MSMKKIIVGLILALCLLSVPVAAAVGYVDCSANRSGLNNASQLNISQTAAVDNLLLAQITWNSGSGTTIYKPDENWTLIDRKDAYGLSQVLYYKHVQDTTPTTYTWTFDSNAFDPKEVGTISEFSGIDWTTGPIFGCTNAGSSGPIQTLDLGVPGILAVPAGSMLVSCYSTAPPRITTEKPGAMILMCNYNWPNPGSLDLSCFAFNQSWPTTGDTGIRNIHLTQSVFFVAQLVALRSPSVCTQSMSITKTANTTGPVVPGQVVMYNVTVCNKGTEPLTAVKVIDNRTGQHDISGSINTGECKNASWLYTVTDQDACNGTIVNVAYANATACGSSFEVHDNPNATVTLPVTYRAELNITKTTNITAGKVVVPGDWIKYTTKVCNNGTVNLTSVMVRDVRDDGTVTTYTIAELAPGACNTTNYNYQVKNSDVCDGWVNNSVTANATSPCPGVPMVQVGPFTASIPANIGASLNITKEANWTAGSTVYKNMVIKYTIKVCNNGKTTLTNVIVNDNRTGAYAIGTLAPGACNTKTTTTKVTSTDVTNGSLVNYAYATATDVCTKSVVTNPNATVPLKVGINTYCTGTPYVKFSYTPTNPVKGSPVQFTDTSTGPKPVYWDWRFGDGTPNSYVANPKHTYTNSGYYTVTLGIKWVDCSGIVSSTWKTYSKTIRVY